MRILRISQNLYPEQSGGASYHVHAMSRDQAEMGHEVTVITTRDEGDLPRVETRDGYEIRRFDTLVSPLGNDISVGLARYLRQASKFDVIHAHSHLYFSTNLAALKRRIGDIPLAITNHGLYSQSVPQGVFRWYLKTLGRWTFNQADIIFTYSDTDRECVQDIGVTSDIEVIPNGIDINRFNPDGKDNYPIDAEGPVIIFVGRMVPGKHPEIAIDAFQKINDEYPDAKLYFCGEGQLRGELETKVRDFGLYDSVTFLGQIPYDCMPSVYRSADILVLPSRNEGMPRTFLEARASGVRIVTSYLKQIPEDIDGLIQTSLNGYDFAEAITKFIEDEQDLSEIADREEYSWLSTVDKTTSILESFKTNN